MLSRVSLIAAVSVFAVLAAAAGKESKRPECVSKCWDYTQYVSPYCLGDTQCLCLDSEYQNAVYQCLYSQCMTSQFANALHHTLAICHTEHHDQEGPALVRQQPEARRRKRQDQYPVQSVAGSAVQSASVTRSAGASVTRSAGASVTRSAGPSVTRSAGQTQSVSRAQPSVSASAYQSAYSRSYSGNRASPTLSALFKRSPRYL